MVEWVPEIGCLRPVNRFNRKPVLTGPFLEPKTAPQNRVTGLALFFSFFTQSAVEQPSNKVIQEEQSKR